MSSIVGDKVFDTASIVVIIVILATIVAVAGDT